MSSFEDRAKIAYPLWLKCVGTEPAHLSADQLILVNDFVGECVKIAISTTSCKQPDTADK